MTIVYSGNVPDMKKDAQRGRTPFGQRLRDARKTAGLTQVQVAAALKMSQSTLAELETVANSSGRVSELAALYRVDGYYLATGKHPSAVAEDEVGDLLLYNLSRVPADKRKEAAIAAINAISQVMYPKRRRRGDPGSEGAPAPAPAPNPARRQSQETESTGARGPKPRRIDP